METGEAGTMGGVCIGYCGVGACGDDGVVVWRCEELLDGGDGGGRRPGVFAVEKSGLCGGLECGECGDGFDGAWGRGLGGGGHGGGDGFQGIRG